MSRKHNTKHNRSRSHYKDRLRARGLSKAPRMTDVLRGRWRPSLEDLPREDPGAAIARRR